jgi:Carboxypeptidase regulatory-like domain
VTGLWHRGCEGARNNRSWSAPAVAGTLLLFAVILPLPLAHAEATGSISGKVLNATTQAPIVGTEVCAFQESDEPPESPPPCAKTNASGEYTISGLSSGQYTVEFTGASCSGEPLCSGVYITQYYDDKPSGQGATPVQVSAPASTTGIDASLSEGGRITGKVTSTAGAPIEEDVVCAAERTGEALGGCAVTNAAGEYTISGLPSGEYDVAFSGLACSGGSCGQVYVIQFYNDKPSPAAADPVSVSAPKTTAAIDATLVPGGRISGKVISAASGAAIQGANVCALEASASQVSALQAGGCAITNGAGEYTISGLQSGQYKVRFADESCTGPLECHELYGTQFYNDKPSLTAADPVAVSAPETTTAIDARLGTATSGSSTGNSGLSSPVPSTLTSGLARAAATASVKRGRALVRLRCVGLGPCKGVLELFARVRKTKSRSGRAKDTLPGGAATVEIGKARFSLAAGKTETLAVHLTAKGQALVRRAPKKGLTVLVTGSGLEPGALLLKQARIGRAARAHVRRR